MNMSIPADLENFVQSLVMSGSFRGPNEVVGKALQMFKRREEMRREIQVGIDHLNRGDFAEYDKDSFGSFSADIKATEDRLFPRESGES